jgi:hypothetical protein
MELIFEEHFEVPTIRFAHLHSVLPGSPLNERICVDRYFDLLEARLGLNQEAHPGLEQEALIDQMEVGLNSRSLLSESMQRRLQTYQVLAVNYWP